MVGYGIKIHRAFGIFPDILHLSVIREMPVKFLKSACIEDFPEGFERNEIVLVQVL